MEKEMEKMKSHFVLVHGACHGSWCWYKLATLLRSAGHFVTTLDMAASGVDTTLLEEVRSVYDYFKPLMEFMGSLPPEERVILVGHSLGGVGISIAMERFPDKISVAVFVTALMPGPTLTVPTLSQQFHERTDSMMDSEYMFAQGHHNPPTSIIFGKEFLSSKFYQLCSPEDLTLATMLVRSQALFGDEDTLEKTVVTKEKYGSVRRAYIICDEDKVMKEDFQRWIIENNPTDEVKEITGADHMVMLSKPQELCVCLQGIAETTIVD